jgi:two-component system sensor histidine kinase/response regulator
MTEPQILVIDDEPGIREGCKRALTPHGYLVDTAEDGEKGLHKALEESYDLVLIDIMMPGTNGIELITHIHEKDPEIVCIIITGYATVELAVRAIKQGAYDFLTKPFTTDDLLLVVNQGLERRSLSLETKRLHDIEEHARKLNEEKTKLEELDRAKVAFIRLVTHELKAPISAIYTYIDLMINNYLEPSQYQEYLKKCQERAKEQIALISDLLEFGRLKEIKTFSTKELTKIDEVLREVLQQMQNQISVKKISLTHQIGSKINPVQLPSEQVKSIWVNLLSNAIKYTPEEGAIHVALQQEDLVIKGEVKDTGIGIPNEAKEYLFSEFFRAKNAKSLNIPGTGLGLSIVKEIIERAGGKIWYQSALDKGTTFWFTLPTKS